MTHNSCLIVGITTPIENDLLEKEKFAERKEQARKDALAAERVKNLSPYGIDTSFFNLAEMPEAAFTQLLGNTRMAYYESRLMAERKAEDERIAREKAEQDERARIAVENLKLKAEEQRAREEADRIEREKREAEERTAEQKAKEEAERKLVMARDFEKVLAFIQQLKAVQVPIVNDPFARVILSTIMSTIIHAEDNARANL